MLERTFATETLRWSAEKLDETLPIPGADEEQPDSKEVDKELLARKAEEIAQLTARLEAGDREGMEFVVGRRGPFGLGEEDIAEDDGDAAGSPTAKSPNSLRSCEKGGFHVFELEPFSLALWHRPADDSIQRVLHREAGITHVVTVLGEDRRRRPRGDDSDATETEEQPGQATQIAAACAACGIEWTQVCLGNAKINSTLQNQALWASEVSRNGIDVVRAWIRDTQKKPVVLVHCAAGLHRTGFFGYAVLRLLGNLSPEDAYTALGLIRTETGALVGFHRLYWSERFCHWWKQQG